MVVVAVAVAVEWQVVMAVEWQMAVVVEWQMEVVVMVVDLQMMAWQLVQREATSVSEMSSLKINPVQTKYKIEVWKCRICRKAAQLDDDTKTIHTEKNTMFEVEKLLSEVYI